MTDIIHYSFDLWFTLIKSNPVFKKERAIYFHKNFNCLKKSLADVEEIFRSVDLMCNSINEKTGKNIDAEEMYLMVIYQLNSSLEPFGEIDMKILYQEIEQMIFKYAPVIFNEQTITCLDKIKQQQDITMSLLSNTAFIKGSTLRIIIDELQISKYFDFQIYSDEVGMSKPNVDIFNLLLQQVYTTRNVTHIEQNKIMHIGDNPVADILGATAFGFSAFQINTNQKTISDLLH